MIAGTCIVSSPYIYYPQRSLTVKKWSIYPRTTPADDISL